MKRRSFLALMGAAPIAARTAASELVAKQAGISSTGLASYGLRGGEAGQSIGTVILPNMPGRPIHEVWQQAFKLYPAIRAEQESALFEQERVAVLDPDIAVHRSFSMAAKIAYQRQRNVARRLEEMQSPPRWQKSETMFQRIAGMLK